MAKPQANRKRASAKKGPITGVPPKPKPETKMSKALRGYITSEKQAKKIGKIIGQIQRDHLAGRYESPTKKRKLPKDLQDYLDKQERRRQRRSYMINAA